MRHAKPTMSAPASLPARPELKIGLSKFRVLCYGQNVVSSIGTKYRNKKTNIAQYLDELNQLILKAI